MNKPNLFYLEHFKIFKEKYWDFRKEIFSKLYQELDKGNFSLNNEREITSEEALIKFEDRDIPIIETSALVDTNVNEAFINLIKIVYQDYARKEKEEKNNINDNKNSKGIDLKNIDDEDKSVNKDSFMCCNWS